jgi:16S rRNA (adenine1518-N6/adenine1519-N6)-dimethyltransferase
MCASSSLVKSNDPAPKKRLGQHFLRDTGAVKRIVQWIQPCPEDTFLEIGAGHGALSTGLASSGARLIALEFDSDCIPFLRKKLEPFSHAVALKGDILKLDLSKTLNSCIQTDQKWRIAGNLPYNIGSAIIARMLNSRIPIQDMSFMVQLEVAQRITAQPGSRRYGYLSVHCQHRSSVQMGPKISPGSFVPRPRVYSAMVSIIPKSNSPDTDFESAFQEVAKAAFAYRRKTLQNSLRRIEAFCSISTELLGAAGIDGMRRAEQLSVEEYEHLAQIYHTRFLIPKQNG